MVSDVTETQVNSELEILRSHDVLDPVADPGWAKVPISERTPAAISQHEALLAVFDKKLETEPVRKTNVISVSYRARSRGGNDSLRQLAQLYLEQHRKMQRPTGASAFFASKRSATQGVG